MLVLLYGCLSILSNVWAGFLQPAGCILIKSDIYFICTVEWRIRWAVCCYKQGRWQKFFRGGPIRIKPELTTKTEEFLKFVRFKRECVKIKWGMALPCPPLSTPMAMWPASFGLCTALTCHSCNHAPIAPEILMLCRQDCIFQELLSLTQSSTYWCWAFPFPVNKC